MKRERVGMMAAVVAGAIVMASGAVMAESVWIKGEAVELRGGKLPVSPVVATVKKGTELMVLAREGKWIKVNIPAGGAATEGWVFEGVVSTTKVSAGGNLFENMGASKVDTSAASKGLQEGAEKYASGKGMSSRPLNQLIAENGAMDPKELERFMMEGRVGAR